MKTIITHSGNFHADDVCAVATLQLYYGKEEIKVIRTRDEAIIKTGDIVLDVGGVYDPASFRFDHHQAGAPVRENGIPYAAFGLIWREYGEKVCKDARVAAELDISLVQPVDAGDNGVSLYTPLHPEVRPVELYQIIHSYLPESGTTQEVDAGFFEAVDWVRGFLSRSILYVQGKLHRKDVIEQIYNAATDKRYLVADEAISSTSAIVFPEVQLVVYPERSEVPGRWKVTAVPINYDSFATRVRFPEAWLGLRENELQAVSGITDAVFCHKAGFMCVVGSKESALKVVEMVLAHS